MPQTFLGKTFNIQEHLSQQNKEKVAKNERDIKAWEEALKKGLPDEPGWEARISRAKADTAYYLTGAGAQDIFEDWKISVAGKVAPSLGLETSQLVANPQLATDPQALAKYTGKTPEFQAKLTEAQKNLSPTFTTPSGVVIDRATEKIIPGGEQVPGVKGTMTSEQAAQSAMARTGKKFADIPTGELTDQERTALGLGPATQTLGAVAGSAPTDAGLGKPIEGFPQSSDEMEEWQKKYTFDPTTGKWYEKAVPGQPGGPTGGLGVTPSGEVPGGGGEIPGDGGVITEPSVKTLSFNLDDLITGEFNTDDLINIFSSPVTGQDIDKLLRENAGLRQKFLDSLDPSKEEIQLKSELVNLRSEIQTKQLDFRKGTADIQQELVRTRVMVGKEAELFTQAQLGIQTLAIQESNFLMRLGMEQESREASSKVIAATLGFNDQDLNRMQAMKNQVWNQKMDLYNITAQLSIRAQNTLNIVLQGLTGLDPGDLDSGTVTKLQSLTKSAGIPWSIIQQTMKVKKDEYLYNQYMGDLDRQLIEQKLEGSEPQSVLQDFTNSQKLELEQAGIDWTNPVGRQEALDFLYKKGPENIEEMMTQYKDLIQQYKDNNFSKGDAESLIKSENSIKEDQDIPGPYQDIIDEIYEGKITKKEGGWVEWLKKAAKFVFQPVTGFPQLK